MLNLIICPGFHSVALTQNFIRSLDCALSERMIRGRSERKPFPTWCIYQLSEYFNVSRLKTQPLIGESQTSVSKDSTPDATQMSATLSESALPPLFIGFSAGVLSALGAAHLQLFFGGAVLGLIALDGWGVPLIGPFPVCRLSHDVFTHRTTKGWGGTHRFYADPPVDHLELWGAPALVSGWLLSDAGSIGTSTQGQQGQALKRPGTALECLVELIDELVQSETI